MNIILVGMMGSGKTSAGWRLARMMGWAFLDTDLVIEQRTGRKIREIFEAEGEREFRNLEHLTLLDILEEENQVIATGGGVVVWGNNRRYMRMNGLVFWLDAPPEVLYQRVTGQGTSIRPLLAGDDPLGKLRELLELRRPAYEGAAHYRIDASKGTADAVAREILACYRRHTQGDGQHDGGARGSGRTKL